MDSPKLFDLIYEIVRTIPKGFVASYGVIAKKVGTTPRIVGFALHGNPSNTQTPCHRVVFKDGSLAKGFAFGGADVQRSLLVAENVEFDDDGKVRQSQNLFDL